MYKYIKRIIDFFLALIGLIIIFPIFVIILLILLVLNNGKPFFFQARPGKNEKIFNIIKFKTMTDKKDKNGELLAVEKRLTKFGIFLRKLSLDEIPQLFNVLFGTMSLIGPRPLLVKYLPLYNDFQKRRHEVKPGITGWAQVNGRNAISWEEKFKYDIWYIDNMSFIVDIRIILLTLKKVIAREGVNNQQNLNMPTFTGSSTEK